MSRQQRGLCVWTHIRVPRKELVHESAQLLDVAALHTVYNMPQERGEVKKEGVEKGKETGKIKVRVQE